MGISRNARTLAAIAGATALIAALPSAAGAVTVGVGGISAAGFQSPAFSSLGMHEARYGVAWNAAITRNSVARAQFASWLAAAQAANVIPLVSFSGDGDYVPTVREYTRAVNAFVHRFPTVRRYTAWNEPDWPWRKLARQPQLAAAYFNALSSSCRQCLVLAGDTYLPAGSLRPWLRSYIKGLRVQPKAWALHNYHDVREHSTAQLRVMLSLTRGPIWLDETGGIERRGHWQFPNQSSASAAADERYLFSLPRRYPRVSRIYHYEWQGSASAGWDSGLISPDGKLRAAYWVVAAAAR
jgi:hypothetical protein